MIKEDIMVIGDNVFCNKAFCADVSCDKHPSKIPQNVPVDVKPLNAYCYCEGYVEKKVK